MPRTVRKGPGESEKKAECEHCGSLIGYVNNDIKTQRYTDYGGGPAGNKSIRCPECSKQIVLESW